MALGNLKPNISWHSITVWMSLVLNNFIRNRLTEKSSDLRLVLFKGQVSRPLSSPLVVSGIWVCCCSTLNCRCVSTFYTWFRHVSFVCVVCALDVDNSAELTARFVSALVLSRLDYCNAILTGLSMATNSRQSLRGLVFPSSDYFSVILIIFIHHTSQYALLLRCTYVIFPFLLHELR